MNAATPEVRELFQRHPELHTVRFGNCLEHTVPGRIAEGHAAKVLTTRYLRQVLNFRPDPRDRGRAQLFDALTKSLPGLDKESRVSKSTEIERGCFNEVIAACEGDTAIIRNWSLPAFRQMYSERIYTLAITMDPDSSVVSAGYDNVVELLRHNPQLETLGGLGAAELLPGAYEAETKKVAARAMQGISERVSNLFRCPNCKAKECTYRQVQTRSLDEPATIFCTCKHCGKTFIG